MPAQPAATSTTPRAEITGGLRQLADYLDAHPEIPVSDYGWELLGHPDRSTDAAERAAVDQVAAHLRVPVRDNTARGGHYIAEKTFGRITYQYIHIPARCRAIHQAWSSYADAVTPDDHTPEAA